MICLPDAWASRARMDASPALPAFRAQPCLKLAPRTADWRPDHGAAPKRPPCCRRCAQQRGIEIVDGNNAVLHEYLGIVTRGHRRGLEAPYPGGISLLYS